MPGRVGPPAVLKPAAEMVLQGAGQRARPVAPGGVDHHPRRLVDHRQPVVLVEDLQGDVFRLRGLARDRREHDHDPLAGMEPVGGLSALAAIDRHAAGGDHAAEMDAAVGGEVTGQEDVQPPARLLGGDHELQRLRGEVFHRSIDGWPERGAVRRSRGKKRDDERKVWGHTVRGSKPTATVASSLRDRGLTGHLSQLDNHVCKMKNAKGRYGYLSSALLLRGFLRRALCTRRLGNRRVGQGGQGAGLHGGRGFVPFVVLRGLAQILADLGELDVQTGRRGGTLAPGDSSSRSWGPSAGGENLGWGSKWANLS